MQDFPYHAASGNISDGKRQGGSAILHAEASHIELLKILREQVCEQQNKTVIYRTWSFGPENFHENPKYYLKVTDAVAPHTNLIFSIKHQKGDFHQLTPFNPTLMIGKHRQIIEVQCQREAYGKGAHPYYIGDGVINGWEEYAWLMKPGQPRGLRDVITNRLCAGIWTWSRGGGWEGPFIKNELWCELNAYVIAKFAENPTRSEEDIFNEYAREKLKLRGDDVTKFRELNLLSEQAVLRGQLTTLGAKINVWWTRDHFLGEPDLSDFIQKGLVAKALAEKAESVAMWQRIEKLAHEIHFADTNIQEFVEVSPPMAASNMRSSSRRGRFYCAASWATKRAIMTVRECMRRLRATMPCGTNGARWPQTTIVAPRSTKIWVSTTNPALVRPSIVVGGFNQPNELPGARLGPWQGRKCASAHSARNARMAFAASTALSSAMWARNFLWMAAADRPRRFSPFSASACVMLAPVPCLSGPSIRMVCRLFVFMKPAALAARPAAVLVIGVTKTTP